MTLAASLISLAMSGCTVIITTGIFTDVTTSHGVQIVAAVSTHGTSHGTAHGTALDTVTARLTNTSTRAVFIPRCGSAPLLLTQRFVSGSWTDGENPACPPGGDFSPIQLDPGLTLVAVKVFTASGRFRLVTTVGTSEDFSNSAQSASNSFALP